MNKMKLFIAPVMLGVMLFSFGGSTVNPSAIADMQADKTKVETFITGHVTLEDFLNTCEDEDEVEPESKSADKVEKLKKKKKTKKTKKTKKKSKKKSKKKKKTTYVWIPRTGSKYHKSSRCSNMRSPSKVSLSAAKSLGYTKCSKCW